MTLYFLYLYVLYNDHFLLSQSILTYKNIFGLFGCNVGIFGYGGLDFMGLCVCGLILCLWVVIGDFTFRNLVILLSIIQKMRKNL